MICGELIISKENNILFNLNIKLRTSAFTLLYQFDVWSFFYAILDILIQPSIMTTYIFLTTMFFWLVEKASSDLFLMGSFSKKNIC
jgi:hypothetical protein